MIKTFADIRADLYHEMTERVGELIEKNTRDAILSNRARVICIDVSNCDMDYPVYLNTVLNESGYKNIYLCENGVCRFFIGITCNPVIEFSQAVIDKFSDANYRPDMPVPHFILDADK